MRNVDGRRRRDPRCFSCRIARIACTATCCGPIGTRHIYKTCWLSATVFQSTALLWNNQIHRIAWRCCQTTFLKYSCTIPWSPPRTRLRRRCCRRRQRHNNFPPHLQIQVWCMCCTKGLINWNRNTCWRQYHLKHRPQQRCGTENWSNPRRWQATDNTARSWFCCWGRKNVRWWDEVNHLPVWVVTGYRVLYFWQINIEFS